ncbi:hypothetical protein ACFS5M_06125 [Lacinutrix iliipiscaria]|uniref:Uncharacterized protein n=1 Tax=Lacinutrix iliipiscaria TaxID=1230532 RepID=A0ABW5WN21_9FLAO
MAKDKDLKKNEIDLEEIKKLAAEADKNKNFQLGFETEFEDNILQLDIVDDIQNPDKSYKVYYAIEGILRTHLPKGDKYKEVRDFVREEKIIFLTGGMKKDETGKRGADSRQAYISTHLEVALNALLKWVQEGGNTFDLFMTFRQLNIDRGYFRKDQLSEFNQSLIKSIHYNPKKDKKE